MAEDEIDDESRNLFRKAVSGSRQLIHDKVNPFRPRVRAIPTQRIRDEAEAYAESLSPPPDAHLEYETGNEVLYSRNGVQNSVIRKLRRGQYPIEAELDLHRMTSEEAYKALVIFLSGCRQRNIRCIRIIHGKGLGSKDRLPVLKGKVNHWLRQRDDILAFCTARPVDGGSGAVYVLLKR